jgi:hypothetical protein
MPKVMVQVLVMEIAKRLNFSPPKGGASKYYSPRIIMYGEVLD